MRRFFVFPVFRYLYFLFFIMYLTLLVVIYFLHHFRPIISRTEKDAFPAMRDTAAFSLRDSRRVRGRTANATAKAFH
jgi:hypothetical protein